MRGDVRHLTVNDVMALHIQVMETLGYHPAPLRDAGLLESAVYRPKMAAFYEGADLVRQAALLAVGIAQAQVYVDGNKRTAYIAAEMFLEWNSLWVVADPLDFAAQLEVLAERTDSLEAATSRFEAWLRENTAQKR